MVVSWYVISADLDLYVIVIHREGFLTLCLANVLYQQLMLGVKSFDYFDKT